MKRSDWSIIISTFLYSYLFYKQLAGINFLIFAIFLVITQLTINYSLSKNKTWWFYSALTIVTAFFVMWHNSALAIFANLCSLLLQSAIAYKSDSSVLVNAMKSMYSIAGSYVFMIISLVKRSRDKSEEAKQSNKKGMKFLITLAIIAVVVIFFLIYRSANPLFEKFTEDINLDFISIGWIFFTLAGFFIMYGFYKHQRISMIDDGEAKLPVKLIDKGLKIKSLEKNAGIILFVLLNIMLLSINALDVAYLYVLKKMPEGITHTQFVHNGVGTIIFSIILGIGIILFFFRNALNFDPKNKAIKLLVGLWILQNAMMIVSTGVRNYIYVHDFNLTYKRIGVFIYLSLTIIGLLLTLFKVYSIRSNWYLIRSNAFAWYVFLCISSFFNWDKIICEFNIAHKSAALAKLDKKYLLSLSDESIPFLQKIKEQKGFEQDSANVDGIFSLRESSLLFSGYNNYTPNKTACDKMTYEFLLKTSKYDSWQSWNHRNENIMSELKQLNSSGAIKSFRLRSIMLDSTGLLKTLNNIELLDLQDCRCNNYQFLGEFGKLKELNLSGNNLSSTEQLPGNIALIKLNLSYNSINNISKIEKFSALETLLITNTNLKSCLGIQHCKNLKSIDLSNSTAISDLRGLEELPKLNALTLDGIQYLAKVPLMRQLKSLSLTNQSNYINANLDKFPVLSELEFLNAGNNSNIVLEKLQFFEPRTKTMISRFPNLKHLYLQNNDIAATKGLEAYTQLISLDLSHNNIQNTNFINAFNALHQLDLSFNKFNSISFYDNHQTLTWLNISNNELIGNMEGLEKLGSLAYLNVSNTRFSNLASLKCQKTLKELNISGCRVNTISTLKEFDKLETLHLSSLNDRDKITIKGLKNLKTLYIHSNQTLLNEQQNLQKEFPNLKIIID